jgi:hypothetical protein
LLIHEACNFTFLRGWSGAADRSLLGDALSGDSYRPHTWHPDSRRFIADQMTFGVQGKYGEISGNTCDRAVQFVCRGRTRRVGTIRLVGDQTTQSPGAPGCVPTEPAGTR